MDRMRGVANKTRQNPGNTRRRLAFSKTSKTEMVKIRLSFKLCLDLTDTRRELDLFYMQVCKNKTVKFRIDVIKEEVRVYLPVLYA